MEQWLKILGLKLMNNGIMLKHLGKLPNKNGRTLEIHGTSLMVMVQWPATNGKETISLKQVELWLIKSGFSTKLTIAGFI